MKEPTATFRSIRSEGKAWIDIERGPDGDRSRQSERGSKVAEKGKLVIAEKERLVKT